MFGVNEPANLRIMASTFKEGDPSYAGALGGVALGLASYHILELRDEVPPDVWDAQMAMEELQIEDDLRAQILDAMEGVRAS